MDSRLNEQLEQATSLFYSFRFIEAYAILRRYFDRMPFRIEEGHAQYIGVFVRVLLELGKEYDLKFYLAELEKQNKVARSPMISFQLGYVYAHLKEPRAEAARQVFESLLADPKGAEFHLRAKFVLANIYLAKGDFTACRLLVGSMPDSDDPFQGPLVAIWRAVVLRHEKRFSEAHVILDRVRDETLALQNWYAYFSSWIAKIKVQVDEGKIDAAEQGLGRLEEELKGKRCRSIQRQLDHLNEMLEKGRSFGTLSLSQNGKEHIVIYRSRKLVLDASSLVEKLVLMFIKKRFLNRNAITQLICGRPYEAGRDERVIYAYVRYARNRLSALGLPSEAIARKHTGYRLMPNVEIERE